MTELQFKELFLKSRGGDKKCYEQFLREIHRVLKMRLMKSMNPGTRSQEQVEDLVQEVLISIHNKRDLFEADKPLLPWIFAIARYRLIDSLRSDKRRPQCVEWIEKFDGLITTELPKMAGEESGEHLLADLSEKQRTVLRLAKVDEIPLEQIAEQQGMSLSAVKVMVHRSLKTLRNKYR